MFSRKKQPPIKSLIAHGTRIEGNVLFEEGIRIDGDVVGDIRASTEQPSILVISPMATPNCSTYGRSNCSRQDGQMVTIRA